MIVGRVREGKTTAFGVSVRNENGISVVDFCMKWRLCMVILSTITLR